MLQVTELTGTFLYFHHLPDGVKSAHLTARESVNMDDLINCDFFISLSAAVRPVRTGRDSLALLTLPWLKSNCLLDCPAVCSVLLPPPYGAQEGELSVALYVRNYVHQTPQHNLTSHPLLCICYFIQLILYNVVRRRNFTRVYYWLQPRLV